MAVLEQSALMVTRDAAGNDVLVYPITTIENVDGALTEEEIENKIQGTTIPYENLEGTPETYPPSEHTHSDYATAADTYTKQEVEDIVASLQEQLNNAIVSLTVSDNVITFTKGNGDTDSITVTSIYG